MSLFAGIDMGTRAVRCVIVDEQGKTVASGSRPWRDAGPRSNRLGTPEPGLDEVDTEAVLEAVADATGQALSGCDAGEVRAVGVTSQRSGVVFVDEHGSVVQAGSNTDARALIQGMQLQRDHGEVIYRIAGRLPAILYMPARLAWLKMNHPADHERVRWALSLGDWIASVLSGVAATEPMQAAEHLVFDVAGGRWSDELRSALDVPATILPPVVSTGTPSGVVTPAAAARFGVPPGTPVVPAGTDTQAALVGLGVLEPGHGTIVAGTTMLVSRVLDAPAADPERKMWLSPHAPPGRWVHEVHCGEAGAPVDWMAGLLGTDARALAAEATAGEAGAAGIVFVDPSPSPASDFPLIRRAGLSMPAPLLALGRPRADVARALFEGIAYGACAGLGWLTDRHGAAASISMAGGVATSEVFRAAVAGVCEQPVRAAATADTSALGAAIVAAVEHHGGLVSAVEAMADEGILVEPDASLGYRAHFSTWEAHARAFEEGTIRLKDMM